MFCGAIETEQDLHREKEARRRDREHLEHREGERIYSESPGESFKYFYPLFLYKGERRTGNFFREELERISKCSEMFSNVLKLCRYCCLQRREKLQKDC